MNACFCVSDACMPVFVSVYVLADPCVCVSVYECM